MNELKVEFENCYGIKKLVHEFKFPLTSDSANAFVIYAPNGIMKTSFTKSFDDLSKGNLPCDARFGRPSLCTVKQDGIDLDKATIYILRADSDLIRESSAVTNILVDPEKKQRYDDLKIGIEKAKTKLINSLNKTSKVVKTNQNLEKQIISDSGENNFYNAIKSFSEQEIEAKLSDLVYQNIFNENAKKVWGDANFQNKAEEFNQRYQKVFEQSGGIYQKGIFNPTSAEESVKVLDKQGFFKAGHKVQLKGNSLLFTKEEIEEKLKTVNALLDGDKELAEIRKKLASNAQTNSFTIMLEKMSITDVEILLDSLKPGNIHSFKKRIWISYLDDSLEAKEYLSLYEESKEEIEKIEKESSDLTARWKSSIELFNSRFVDMPFTLDVENQTAATLGVEPPKLSYVFENTEEGEDVRVNIKSNKLKTLSKGEQRALYLLNFMFDVEERRLNEQETLFIIDDVADSFDYKNKHAIIQYLSDLGRVDYFHQIILTHNFDFFRALFNLHGFSKGRFLMANKSKDSITLDKADGVKNYFKGILKEKIDSCNMVLIASVPFTRNIIEYTDVDGEESNDYKLLTSLLHWKEDSASINVSDYLAIYNKVFNTSHNCSGDEPFINLLFTTADEICSRDVHPGLALEDKVLLSIAIRIKAEQYMLSEIRINENNSEYWYKDKSQFVRLKIKCKNFISADSEDLKILNRVGMTVSSNIHLNSFMYEPIMDLGIEHLIELFEKVKALTNSL